MRVFLLHDYLQETRPVKEVIYSPDRSDREIWRITARNFLSLFSKESIEIIMLRKAICDGSNPLDGSFSPESYIE